MNTADFLAARNKQEDAQNLQAWGQVLTVAMDTIVNIRRSRKRKIGVTTQHFQVLLERSAPGTRHRGNVKITVVRMRGGPNGLFGSLLMAGHFPHPQDASWELLGLAWAEPLA